LITSNDVYVMATQLSISATILFMILGYFATKCIMKKRFKEGECYIRYFDL